MPKDAFTNNALGFGWKQTGFEWQCGERGEKLGQAIGRQIPLHQALFNRFEPGKRKCVMGVLLKQRCDRVEVSKQTFMTQNPPISVLRFFLCSSKNAPMSQANGGTSLVQTRIPLSSASEDAGVAGRSRIPSGSIVISIASPGFSAKRSRMALGTTIRLMRSSVICMVI